jgi:serine/threonine protein kinase
MIGRTIGPYQILAELGRGGMGEVYRARDTKLNRDVALKILPEAFADDPDRLMRFTREAQTLASLNHPNIAAIYGIEDRAIVMELVEGRDLSEVSGGGAEAHALHITDVIPIARQIAAALEAAHEAGIIHRDLKPANTKVKDDGTVKVLDFGLAKALDSGTSGLRDSGTSSPTMTSPAMTAMGMILGTAAYMAPEQAKGRPVDNRADIWAFGAVLYEMLTGTRAFAGSEVTEVLASVFARDPDWTRLPEGLPPVLGIYLRRCLQKDPKQRIHDIVDMRLALDGAFETPVTEVAASAVAQPVWRRPMPMAVAASVATALIAVAACVAVPAGARRRGHRARTGAGSRPAPVGRDQR